MVLAVICTTCALRVRTRELLWEPWSLPWSTGKVCSVREKERRVPFSSCKQLSHRIDAENLTPLPAKKPELCLKELYLWVLQGVQPHLGTAGSHSVKQQNVGPSTACQNWLAEATVTLSHPALPLLEERELVFPPVQHKKSLMIWTDDRTGMKTQLKLK